MNKLAFSAMEAMLTRLFTVYAVRVGSCLEALTCIELRVSQNLKEGTACVGGDKYSRIMLLQSAASCSGARGVSFLLFAQA